jgi:hypothetical protein
MAIFYRDATVLITSSEVEIDDRRYPLARLGQVWHRRSRRFAQGSYILLTRVGTVALALGALLGVVAVLVWFDFGAYTWHVRTGAVIVLIFLAAVAGFGVDPLLELLDRSHEQGHGVHEIWARADGREILLFSTTDALRFGKVYRALRRAMEHAP